MNRPKIFILTSLALCTMQVLTILASWIASAVFPEAGFTSLLSGTGLRWLFGQSVSSGCTEYMAWLMIGSTFIGTFMWSELPKKIITFKSCDYNEKTAIVFFFIELLIGIGICLAFALVPHSPFLGIDGRLFTGPFLKSSILVLGSTVFAGSITFLLLTERCKSYSLAADALLCGLKAFAPLTVVLFLLKVTIEMIVFAFF